MAISAPGPIIGAISGALGGIVFVSNQQGAVIRAKGRTPSVKSQRQTRQLNKMQAARLRWQGLSDAQRTQWDASAANVIARDRLGRRHRLSGFQLYCKVNGISTLFDTSFYDTPLATFNRYDPGSITVNLSISGEYTLQPSILPLAGIVKGQVWIARPHSTKVRKSYNHWVVCGVPVFAPPFYPINNIVIAAVGELTLGERVGLRYAVREIGGLQGAIVEQHATTVA